MMPLSITEDRTGRIFLMPDRTLESNDIDTIVRNLFEMNCFVLTFKEGKSLTLPIALKEFLLAQSDSFQNLFEGNGASNMSKEDFELFVKFSFPQLTIGYVNPIWILCLNDQKKVIMDLDQLQAGDFPLLFQYQTCRIQVGQIFYEIALEYLPKFNVSFEDLSEAYRATQSLDEANGNADYQKVLRNGIRDHYPAEARNNMVKITISKLFKKKQVPEIDPVKSSLTRMGFINYEEVPPKLLKYIEKIHSKILC